MSARNSIWRPWTPTFWLLKVISGHCRMDVTAESDTGEILCAV
jgi:hypothetical protein